MLTEVNFLQIKKLHNSWNLNTCIQAVQILVHHIDLSWNPIFDSIYGQVMHFPPRPNKFVVMQLYIPTNMPNDVLRWVIAHELGHIMQGRNWQETNGSDLETDASAFAEKIGYPKTDKISQWMWPES